MPSITINIPETWTTKIRGHEMTVESARFTDLATFAATMFEYAAVNRWFNDRAAHGLGPAPRRDDFATDKEFAAAMAEFTGKCLANAVAIRDRAYAGEYAKERGASEPADPVAAEAVKIARGIVSDKFGTYRKETWKVTPDQMTAARAFAAKHELDLSDGEAFLKKATDIVSRLPAIRDDAKARVEKAAALADLI